MAKDLNISQVLKEATDFTALKTQEQIDAHVRWTEAGIALKEGISKEINHHIDALERDMNTLMEKRKSELKKALADAEKNIDALMTGIADNRETLEGWKMPEPAKPEVVQVKSASTKSASIMPLKPRD